MSTLALGPLSFSLSLGISLRSPFNTHSNYQKKREKGDPDQGWADNFIFYPIRNFYPGISLSGIIRYPLSERKSHYPPIQTRLVIVVFLLFSSPGHADL